MLASLYAKADPCERIWPYTVPVLMCISGLASNACVGRLGDPILEHWVLYSVSGGGGQRLPRLRRRTSRQLGPRRAPRELPAANGRRPLLRGRAFSKLFLPVPFNLRCGICTRPPRGRRRNCACASPPLPHAGGDCCRWRCSSLCRTSCTRHRLASSPCSTHSSTSIWILTRSSTSASPPLHPSKSRRASSRSFGGR